MDILRSILLAGFMAIFPPFFLVLVFIAPFWIWHFFFGRGPNVELPPWLDRSMFPVALGLWLIGFVFLMWAALTGVLDS